MLSTGERIYRTLAALLFMSIGIYALAVQAWHWPGTLQHPAGIFLVGWPKDFMAFAAFSAAASLALPMAAHYDSSKSVIYRILGRIFHAAAWILFVASFIFFATHT